MQQQRELNRAEQARLAQTQKKKNGERKALREVLASPEITEKSFGNITHNTHKQVERGREPPVHIRIDT
jgi:hypothetical protein